MLLEQVRKTLAGTYRPANYSAAELDPATVLYELGGGAAPYAIHHSQFAFPCQSTVRKIRRELQLRVTFGQPRMIDILENFIKTMFETSMLSDSYPDSLPFPYRPPPPPSQLEVSESQDLQEVVPESWGVQLSHPIEKY